MKHSWTTTHLSVKRQKHHLTTIYQRALLEITLPVHSHAAVIW